MAIEITPRRKIKSSAWSIVFTVFSLVLIAVLTISYFYLNSSIKKIKQEIQQKEKALTPTPSEKTLDRNLLLFENQINVFKGLILKHRNLVNVFSFLENVCLPNVQFYDFGFDSSQNAVSLSGKTDNFVSLEKQILVLKNESLVKSVKISDLSEEKEGGVVDFGLILTFNPKIFH